MIFKYSLIVLVLGALTVNSSSIYYVTEEGREDCPFNETCHNLQSVIEMFLRDDTTFRLLQGTHYIQDRQLWLINHRNITIEGYKAVMMQGFHETIQQSNVTIQCIGKTGGIRISNGNDITIRYLTIINCGYRSLNYFIFLTTSVQTESFVSVLAIYTINLFLYNVSIQNSTQYGLVAIDTVGLIIESCSFAHNSLELSKKFPCNGICHGGNLVILYYADIFLNMLPYTNVSIINSNFSFGISGSIGDIPQSGLLVLIRKVSTFVDVLLDSITAYGNIGNLGANIALYVLASHFKITLKDSLSTMANYRYDGSFGTSLGGGVLVRISSNSDYNDNTIQIINSSFTNNTATYGGGLCILQLNNNRNTSIEVISSTIENNSGIIGIGIAIIELLTLQTQLENVFITNTNISSSVINYSVNDFKLFNLGYTSIDLHLIQLRYFDTDCARDDIASLSSAIGLVNVHNVTFNDVMIRDNSVTGIRAFNSHVIFKGTDNVIEGNDGSNGGGLALLNESFLVLDPPTHIYFNENSAIKGGGIYTDELSLDDNTCFYALKSNNNLVVKLEFEGNTASRGGSALYGEDIDDCLPHPDYSSFLLSNFSRDSIFDFSKQFGDSIISSNPYKVCLCENSKADCAQSTQLLSSVPGGIINIQVVLVGDQDGFSTGTLSVEPIHPSSLFLTNISHCQDVSIPVTLGNTNITSIKLVLSVNTNDINGTNIEKVTVNVSIDQCPPGFELKETTKYVTCDCHYLITTNFPNTVCDVSAWSIMKENTGWIGFDNSSSCVLLNKKCPFDYCITDLDNITISLDDQSQQCSSSRSGILCGHCKENFSLTLGSNECDNCLYTHMYLPLLIGFLVAGVALVVLLIVLNLTVSMSTINGLIFFANIVHINENSIFLQTGRVELLFQFISWINLDFGIKVCFYHGMDNYAKAWLQFVFPFYIWFIIAMIILSTKYSTRISRLVSRNVIPVLSTLVLLSYTKLFRAIISSFYRSELISDCENMNGTTVWTADGNINYFDAYHTPLLLFSILILVLLIIPYTLSLLLSPLLESYLSRYKLFKWWVKCKPFIDAYNGPYKDRYRFWTGLLLLARLVIVLTVSFSNDLNVNRLVTLIVSIMLLSFSWIVDGVYTNRRSNTLEWFFIVNLAIIISVSGYDDHNIRKILVYLCVSVSFLVFLGIVSFHVWVRCSEIDFTKKCVTITTKLMKKKVPPQPIDLENQQRMSDVDIVNRDISREAISTTDISTMEYSVDVLSRESIIFDD